MHRPAPWLIAFFYYHVSWLLFLIRPQWSYRLNADFEDHAEHAYMRYVADPPSWRPSPIRAATPPGTGITPQSLTCSARSVTTSGSSSWTAWPT